MVKSRKEIKPKDRWDLEAVYPNLDACLTQFKALKTRLYRDPCPLTLFKGRLSEGPESIKAALDNYFAYQREFSHLHNYVLLKFDEDLSDESYKSALSDMGVSLNLRRELWRPGCVPS